MKVVSIENEVGALFVIVGFGSLSSVAVAVPMFTMVCSPVASAVMFDGAVITGGVVSGVVSTTVTVLVTVTASFPDESTEL